MGPLVHGIGLPTFHWSRGLPSSYLPSSYRPAFPTYQVPIDLPVHITLYYTEGHFTHEPGAVTMKL